MNKKSASLIFLIVMQFTVARLCGQTQPPTDDLMKQIDQLSNKSVTQKEGQPNAAAPAVPGKPIPWICWNVPQNNGAGLQPEWITAFQVNSLRLVPGPTSNVGQQVLNPGASSCTYSLTVQLSMSQGVADLLNKVPIQQVPGVGRSGGPMSTAISVMSHFSKPKASADVSLTDAKGNNLLQRKFAVSGKDPNSLLSSLAAQVATAVAQAIASVGETK